MFPGPLTRACCCCPSGLSPESLCPRAICTLSACERAIKWIKCPSCKSFRPRTETAGLSPKAPANGCSALPPTSTKISKGEQNIKKGSGASALSLSLSRGISAPRSPTPRPKEGLKIHHHSYSPVPHKKKKWTEAGPLPSIHKRILGGAP